MAGQEVTGGYVLGNDSMIKAMQRQGRGGR